jgi:isopenicillin-N epimerase
VLIEAELPFPDPAADAIVEAIGARIGPRTKLVILDHITSPSALILPLEKLIARCREAGVKVLIDGAHGPGQVALDLSALAPDWYVGNCHKWLMAPKGCAFLWARPDRQQVLHPVIISHGYGKGYLAEFDWTGTRDPSPWLAVDAAIAFHRGLGGPALMARNDRLALDAATLLVDRLGTRTGAGPAFHGSMQLVQLPLDGPGTPQRALDLRARLLDEFRCDAPLHCLAGKVWLRLSAQAYNTIDDYKALAEITARLCRPGN